MTNMRTAMHPNRGMPILHAAWAMLVTMMLLTGAPVFAQAVTPPQQPATVQTDSNRYDAFKIRDNYFKRFPYAQMLSNTIISP